MPTFPSRSIRGILVGIAALAATSSTLFAQAPLYTNTFDGTKEGQHPQGWILVGADTPDFWFVTRGVLNTGNGDDFDLASPSFLIVGDSKAQDWTDYSVQTDFWMQQAQGQVLLAARWQNRDNYYMGALSTGEKVSDPITARIVKVENSQRFVLNEVVNGRNGVTIPSFRGDSAASAKRLNFEVVGSKLTLSMDGKVILTATDPTFSKGACGLGQQANIVNFDNVVVAPVTGAAPTPATGAQPMPGVPPATTVPDVIPAGGAYRLLIMNGLDQARAEALRADMMKDFPAAINVVPEAGGTYRIYYGFYLSEQEATDRMNYLKHEEGLTVREVVKVTAEQAEKTLQESAAVASDTRYRVVAQEFPDANTAGLMKKNLEESGYFPVEVALVSGKNQVLCGPAFINKTDADSLASDLKETGFFAANVVEVKSQMPLSMPGDIAQPPGAGSLTPDIFANIGGSGFKGTPEEMAEVKRIAAERERVLRGEATAEEFKSLMDEIKRLSEGQKEIVSRIEQSEADRQQLDRRKYELKVAVDAAQDRKDYDKALALLADWEKLDPANASIELKRRIINAQKAGGSSDSVDAGASQQRRTEGMIAEAKRSEEQGLIDQALNQWTQIRSEVPPTSAPYAQASEAIARLKDLKDKKLADERNAAARQKTMMVVVVICIVLLVALVAGVMVMMMIRSRRRDQELLRQVQELTVRPLKEIDEKAGPKLLEGDQEPAAAKSRRKEIPAPAKEPPKAKPAEPAPVPVPPPAPAPIALKAADDDVRIKSPVEEPVVVPAAKKAAPPPAPPAPEPKAMPEPIALDETPPELEIPAAIAASAFESPSSIFETAPQKPPTPPPAEESVEEDLVSPEVHAASASFLDIPSQDDLTAILTGALGDSDDTVLPAGFDPKKAKAEALAEKEAQKKPVAAAPAVSDAEKETPVAAAAAAGNGNLIYSQDFDDEEDGAKPRNWIGDYDYSSLSVSAQTPAPGSKRCLRFEKRQGSGSAYYACRFPDITGKILVEFDLRCDDKNKYLLGFYIEKDEDFRQSIHTIVHRTSPQVAPTLRIQGEPTQYSLGTWRHMKYEIDLGANSVTGYVDGDVVAENVKLASPPKSINTLSIRDNLATTGILLIDNIRIHKV